MSQSSGRLAIALLVVAAGAALAWTFRKTESPAESAGPAERGIVYRESPPPSDALTPPARLSLSGRRETPLAEANAASGERTFAAASNDGLINVVPRENNSEPGGSPRVARRIPLDGPSGPPPANPGSPSLGVDPPSRPDFGRFNSGSSSATREHRIVDGDTLEALAARYLGDPAAANAIFDSNRDVLPAPDVLPIGVVLRIPAVNSR